jgi:hypothetical protein
LVRTHFWLVTACGQSGCRIPRYQVLNGTMPAMVNKRDGSSGIREKLG